MKYPYIGKAGRYEAIFTSKDSGIDLSNGVFYTLGFNEYQFKNITREYLSNTWGVVESKEHAEFIIELTKNCSIRLYSTQNKKAYFCCDGKYLWFTGFEQYALNRNRKQITIPLPPKDVKNEWPQVGDEVTWGERVVSGEIKAISEGLAWIKNEYGNYCSEYIDKLKKPKTPEEELRDELMIMATQAMHNSDFDTDHNCYYLISGLMKKYNITKKDKGDE